MLRPDYPLLTDRLAYRPYTEADLDALHDMQRREEVTRYLYWGPHSLDDSREMLAHRIAQATISGEGDGIVLVVETLEGAHVVGDVALILVSLEHRSGEFGCVISPAYQGRGFATEACDLMLRLGFGDLGLHRMVARCDARNTASWRLMEALGMRREAHLRENEWVKGEWTDELDYAILEDEWRARVALRSTP